MILHEGNRHTGTHAPGRQRVGRWKPVPGSGGRRGACGQSQSTVTPETGEILVWNLKLLMSSPDQPEPPPTTKRLKLIARRLHFSSLSNWHFKVLNAQHWVLPELGSIRAGLGKHEHHPRPPRRSRPRQRDRCPPRKPHAGNCSPGTRRASAKVPEDCRRSRAELEEHFQGPAAGAMLPSEMQRERTLKPDSRMICPHTRTVQWY